MKKTQNLPDLKKIGHFHFVGIGGISMSTLAILSVQAGHTVTGSDRSENDGVRLCRSHGIPVRVGHSPEAVKGAGLVIHTAAIPADAPELTAAKEQGIPCLTRSEFLGLLMQDYRQRIGISGTHGKTSTTAMIAHVLTRAGKDPTVAAGGVLSEEKTAYRLGGRDFFVYEACEYKASFLDFYPTVAVINNIELDHTDFYADLAQVIDAFAGSLAEASVAVVNRDDPNAMLALEKARAKDPRLQAVTFSAIHPEADIFAEDMVLGEKGLYTYRPRVEGKSSRVTVTLPVPGRFNLYNSLAALAAVSLLGVSAADFALGIADFRPAARRFEKKYEGSVTVADDYAHHPSEIAATLSGLRPLLKEGGRLLVAFQSHTYSRTRDLFEGFVSSLSLADRVYVAPIYAAREAPDPRVSAEILASALPNAAAYPTFEAIAEAMLKESRPGDLLLSMGAGDVNRVSDLLAGHYKSGDKKGKGSTL